jgi:hypothetical protein
MAASVGRSTQAGPGYGADLKKIFPGSADRHSGNLPSFAPFPPWTASDTHFGKELIKRDQLPGFSQVPVVPDQVRFIFCYEIRIFKAGSFCGRETCKHPPHLPVLAAQHSVHLRGFRLFEAGLKQIGVTFERTEWQVLAMLQSSHNLGTMLDRMFQIRPAGAGSVQIFCRIDTRSRRDCPKFSGGQCRQAGVPELLLHQGAKSPVVRFAKPAILVTRPAERE